MNGALLLASAGDTHWVGSVARILRDLGFAVQTGMPVSSATADIGLVIADADADTGIPDTLLGAWRGAGAVCALVLAPDAARTLACGEAGVACLRQPVTEAAILGLLISQHYVALTAREAAGVEQTIAEQTFGNPAFAAELVQALVSSTRTDLARLRAAADDLDTVRGVAHRLKAPAHYVGCHALRLMAQRLEDAARDGDAATAAALAAIVGPTMVRLLSLLATLPAAE
ncbi:Hpt domain-containing protein [Cupriavidus lacunae]|uniref:Hpt domain-containing protein n=1 Tax=Cupriavidus lacunae TaxID=2666307 RepID=A0A370NQ53_9BURK|nr:Hpt domain-containing protein [Cupriavidus lacunae]RDK07701.1 Hpt domain-containing protein [Cupriavidus lacunae]